MKYKLLDTELAYRALIERTPGLLDTELSTDLEKRELQKVNYRVLEFGLFQTFGRNFPKNFS